MASRSRSPVPGRCSTSGRLTRCWTDSTVRSARSRTRSAWDPSRALRDAWRELSPRTCSGARRSSTISRRRRTWRRSPRRRRLRLREMGARGERSNRWWAGPALGRGSREDAARSASVEAGARRDGRLRPCGAALSAAAEPRRGDPERAPRRADPAEVDDAYLEIQTLKRQVRELQREVRALAGEPAPKRRESKEKSRGEAR